jgi:hypothetical protein
LSCWSSTVYRRVRASPCSSNTEFAHHRVRASPFSRIAAIVPSIRTEMTSIKRFGGMVWIQRPSGGYGVWCGMGKWYGPRTPVGGMGYGMVFRCVPRREGIGRRGYGYVVYMRCMGYTYANISIRFPWAGLLYISESSRPLSGTPVPTSVSTNSLAHCV